jgi:hypothetical protein
MLTLSRPEPIAETDKVLLVDALQEPHDRLLDDFIVQRSDTDRALAPVRFGYVDSLRRLCSLGSPVKSTVKIGEPFFKALLVVTPTHLVDADRRSLLQVEEGFAQQVHGSVVQQ